MKVTSWTDKDWEINLKNRLDRSMKFREAWEGQWKTNLSIANNISFTPMSQFNISFDNLVELESGEVDNGDSEIGINEIFKYVRFWHSQMSANPPSTIIRPRSSDPSDRRKADAADRIARYLRKDKNMQEVADDRNYKALIFGTGFSKVIWDEEAGDIFDFNEETSDVKMEGDLKVYSPATEDVWLDPDARRQQDLRFVFERVIMPLDEALLKYPEHEKKLRESIMSKNQDAWQSWGTADPTNDNEGSVELFFYYEKGLPVNGGVGRSACMLRDGFIFHKGPNKHYKASIPIKILTYIDVPGQVYGKSVIEYCARIQEMLKRMDSATLDAIQSHGVVRMALHESSDIEDEAISNSNWDYIKYGGSAPPHFINPPQLMPDMARFRDALVMAIRDLFGVNDSMMGIQRREQSAVSQQTSIESGTMLHRRLFTKFALVTEAEFRDMLGLVRTKWDTPRQVLVLGKEKAFEAADFVGADIAGGFDFDVEYGTSLPLDPNMAREQLMLLMPALKEAGVSMKEILRRFRLNEVEGTLDIMDLAADRQREIFEEMIAKSTEGVAEYIAPRELEEHQGMLEYAYVFIMTSEFKYLPEEARILIEKHIREREGYLQKKVAPPSPTGVQQLPGMPGVSGSLQPELQEEPVPL